MLSSLSMFFNVVGDVSLDLTNTITDSHISFPSRAWASLFETNDEIGRILRQYYLYGALTQLYKKLVVEFAGDTAGLVTSLGQVGTDVKDFFYDPSTSIITSPTEAAKIRARLSEIYTQSCHKDY